MKRLRGLGRLVSLSFQQAFGRDLQQLWKPCSSSTRRWSEGGVWPTPRLWRFAQQFIVAFPDPTIAVHRVLAMSDNNLGYYSKAPGGRIKSRELASRAGCRRSEAGCRQLPDRPEFRLESSWHSSQNWKANLILATRRLLEEKRRRFMARHCRSRAPHCCVPVVGPEFRRSWPWLQQRGPSYLGQGACSMIAEGCS